MSERENDTLGILANKKQSPAQQTETEQPCRVTRGLSAAAEDAVSLVATQLDARRLR